MSKPFANQVETTGQNHKCCNTSSNFDDSPRTSLKRVTPSIQAVKQPTYDIESGARLPSLIWLSVMIHSNPPRCFRLAPTCLASAAAPTTRTWLRSHSDRWIFRSTPCASVHLTSSGMITREPIVRAKALLRPGNIAP